MPKNLEIRLSREADLDALLEIYNDEVLTGTATFDEKPWTPEERRLWLEAHNKNSHSLLSAVYDSRVAGYASLSPYNEKDAYRTTAELSVYVGKEFRGLGIGRALMEALIEKARAEGTLHLIVSLITSDNAVSVKLHRALGFEFAGRLPEVGRKFGQTLSVDFYCLKLSDWT